MANLGCPPPTIVSDVSEQVQPFRFFDLPRELCDWCYDYMTGPTISLITLRERNAFDSEDETEDQSNSRVKDDTTLEVTVSNPPLSNVLCVSQQMAGEYRQRAIKQIMLNFHDRAENENFPNLDLSNIEFPHFKSVTRANYFGVALCNGETETCWKDTLKARSWLRLAVGNLRNLKEVHVNMALQCMPPSTKCVWPNYEHSAKVQHSLQKFMEIKCVTHLQVFGGEQGVFELHNPPDRNKLYVSWTKKDGWIAAKSAK